jgi:hypothetical protein
VISQGYSARGEYHCPPVAPEPNVPAVRRVRISTSGNGAAAKDRYWPQEIVTNFAHSAKPRHGIRPAVEDGDEAIVMTVTWSAEFFLDRSRVTDEDDSIAVSVSIAVIWSLPEPPMYVENNRRPRLSMCVRKPSAPPPEVCWSAFDVTGKSCDVVVPPTHTPP